MCTPEVTLQVEASHKYSKAAISSQSRRKQLAGDLFDLLLETHVKARQLFAKPGCADGMFTAAAGKSPQADELLQTHVPRWKLLYSEAVQPAFCAASTSVGTECYDGDSEAEFT